MLSGSGTIGPAGAAAAARGNSGRGGHGRGAVPLRYTLRLLPEGAKACHVLVVGEALEFAVRQIYKNPDKGYRESVCGIR